MKKVFLFATLTYAFLFSHGQDAVAPLSKQAAKGYLYLSDYTNDKLTVTFKMPVKKKSNEVLYEQYVFDNGMKFQGKNPVSYDKEEKPDRTNKSLRAYVGGSTSFNVLSQKLRINREEWEETWNNSRQRYEYKKRIKSETVKLKKDSERYYGHASYRNYDNGGLLVVVAYDAPKKSDGRLFSVLNISTDLDVEEAAVTSAPGYSLVYTDRLENDNVYLIMAPPSGSEYVYAEYTPNGKEVFKNTFIAPSPNTLIFKHAEYDGMVYFIALSRNGKDNYPKVFEDYAPIPSPGYSNAANYQQDKYEKKAFNREAQNFHLLKFNEGKMIFSGTTPVKDFASRLKTPPGQKKGSAYQGKKFDMQESFVTSSGEFLLAGQISKRVTIKSKSKGSMFGDPVVKDSYLDIICFHFDSEGKLKAQYAVNKLINDKKSKIFPMKHNFISSADGNTVYWEVMEVKGAQGYSDFMEAYHGRLSYTGHYFPKVAKINTGSATITDFDVFKGKGKYLLYTNNSLVWDKTGRTRYYVARDKKFQNIFVSKYEMP